MNPLLFSGESIGQEPPYWRCAVISYHTGVQPNSHHNVTVGFLIALLAWPVTADVPIPPWKTEVRITPHAKDWGAAPVVLKGDQLPAEIDPRSIRLFQMIERREEAVSFRLETRGIPPRLISMSWIKEGTGEIDYILRFDTLDSGQNYEYPDALPMVGCGEPLAIGSRSAIGWMTAGYNSIYEAVDWDGDGDEDLFSSQSGPPEANTMRGIYYYENLGPRTPGVLSPPERLLEETGQVSILDWNQDGSLDLICSHKVFLNTGPQGAFLFGEPVEIEELEGGAHCFADWDGDGLFDAWWGRVMPVVTVPRKIPGIPAVKRPTLRKASGKGEGPRDESFSSVTLGPWDRPVLRKAFSSFHRGHPHWVSMDRFFPA